MIESVEIEFQDLQILFNLLAEAGEPVCLRYPYYDAAILEYDPLEAKITDATTRTHFRSAPYVPDSNLRGDPPEWHDIADALLTAGWEEYENEAEAGGRIAQELTLARDDPQPVYFAFDTSALYHRLASRALHTRLLPPQSSGGESQMRSFRYVISQGVREELSHHFSKYTEGHIQLLRSVLETATPVEALRNRTLKQGRKASAGLAEEKWLKSGLRTHTCPCDKLSGDSEYNDSLIAKSYADFRADHPGRMIMLTTDHGMTRQAELVDLPAIFFNPPNPKEIPRGKRDERELALLIHDLAVNLACVRILGFPALIWGEWTGKPLDWSRGPLRLEWLEGKENSLLKKFLRDLRAARAVRAAYHGHGGRST